MGKVVGKTMVGMGLAVWAFIRFIGVDWPRWVSFFALAVLCWGGLVLWGQEDEIAEEQGTEGG